MEIIVAEKAGFCFGVQRALDTVYSNLDTLKICTYGPLIHNKIVIQELSEKSVKVIEDFAGITDETIVLRSHGVPPSVYHELQKKNIKYIDCTCPFVTKIHKIAKQNYDIGKTIIILGDKIHPEVIGINGWANDKSIIIKNIEDIENIKFLKDAKYTLVVQTTFEIGNFKSIVNRLNTFDLDIEIFNTICSATRERQEEVNILSKKVDKMIIIGDTKSSNTYKLYEISKKNCLNSYLIESIVDLELKFFSQGDKIGISAGASTPPAIIKEVTNTMSEQDNEKTFEEMLNESFVSLHTGDIVKGSIIRINNGEIYVNLGYKSDGIISKEELSDDPSIIAENLYNNGDEIEVFVIRVNDGDGNVLLSKKRIEAQKGMDELETAFKEKTVLKGKVVDVVKGGLMALINGIKVFVPSSQISNRFVEDLKTFKGKELNFNIIEFDRGKRRVVAGRKELAAKEELENKKKIFETLEVGSKHEGKVRRLVDFGAFVDLGGVDGLIHISEMSWGRVKRAKDILSEGDTVTVTIIEFDKEKGKISLSLKDSEQDPWANIETRYPIGAIKTGKVVRMVSFGAFVELEEGIDGLVHISQISEKHVKRPEDELKIGQIINVKITEVVPANKKISLSKKEAEAKEEEVGDDVKESFMVKAKEVADDAVDKTKETLGEAAIVVKEVVEHAVDKTKEVVSETVDNIKEKTEEVVNKVKEKIEEIKEKM